MTQAARLLQRGQAAHAAQFPASISIAGQSYAAATSGEKRERDLLSGGWLQKVSIAFWLPLSAFDAAGQPVPVERGHVTHGGKTYVIASTSRDATGTTLTLKCESPDQ
jgi:hypothetical protein